MRIRVRVSGVGLPREPVPPLGPGVCFVPLGGAANSWHSVNLSAKDSASFSYGL